MMSLMPSYSDLYHGTSISSAEVWNSIGRDVSSSGGSFGGLIVSLKLRIADLNHDSSSVGVKRWLRLSSDSWDLQLRQFFLTYFIQRHSSPYLFLPSGL